MKFLVLALFVAAAVAVPIPEDNGDAVELIVNGVPEGAALELGGIVDMQLNEHVDGQLASSTNLLYPLTAVGIAEAAAAAAEVAAAEEIAPTPIQIADAAEPESDFHNVPETIILPEPAEVVPAPIVMPEPVIPVVVPEPIVMPEPVVPEVVPESIVMPAPVAPEVVPESIVMPEPVAPEVVPESIVMPEPVVPEVVPEVAEPVPEPAAQIPGEIFNNGLVQVQVNAPEDAGMFSTLQNWFSLVVNYISSGIQTSQQIV
ncbi:protein app1-like [Ostrinia furnacalis]|uniref:protein app1-like n=1 Tax=Ostrinia furnacalis TaxID=93504 RepID=UPI00103875EA|nr:protein app1-like [Ostrinia furnacalis]